MKIDVAELDVIFLSYDEPKADEFWGYVRQMAPWAERVHGVEGSDQAHKAAADASTTERFVLIDGDNIPDKGFFDLELDIPENMEDCVFRWKARNVINGLMYGNGGLSCWTREYIRNMKTHENSTGDPETDIEFCFDPKYLAMHDVYSTTYPNGSEYHAWRAGFREGVKLCLDRGKRIDLVDFKTRLVNINNARLMAWLTLGKDEQWGESAMNGAAWGVYKTMLTNWDHRLVRDFSALQDEFTEFKETNYDYRDRLHVQLNVPKIEFNGAQSLMFKQMLNQQHHNLGPMVTEKEIMMGRLYDFP